MHASVRIVLAATLLAAASAAAAPKEAGVWWEVTSESKGLRNAAPPQVERECLPENPERAPLPKDSGACTTTGEKRSGNRVSWKLSCDGIPGEAELVRSGNAFTTTAVFRTPQGEVRWTSRGKKLGGACDPGERDRKEAVLAAYEKRGVSGEERVCETAVQELDPLPFSAEIGICKDPSQRKELCDGVRSRDGLLTLFEPGKDGQRKAAAALCGEDEAKLRARHCPDAMKLANAQDAYLAVVACPDAAAIARKECKGDDPMAASPRYRELCEQWLNRQEELKNAASGDARR